MFWQLTKITGSAWFAADTQVLMGDGSSKPIQDVVVGDEVLAWNQATGENEPRRVVETFVHEGVETWEVETADGQVVTSTAEHPFWVEGKGWTPVRELAAGDVLATADGPMGLVRVEATGKTARVHKFHVDGPHNYHVGGRIALRVHDNCDDLLDQSINIAKHAEGRAMQGTIGTHYVRGVDPRVIAYYVDGVLEGQVPNIETHYLSNGRIGYWDPAKGAVVIEDGLGGTVFTPEIGHRYVMEKLQ